MSRAIELKGWGEVLAALVVAALLLTAGLYAYQKYIKPGAGSEASDKDPGEGVRVNETAASLYLGDLDPVPSLDDLQVRLYAPGLGHGDWALSSSSPSGGVLFRPDIFGHVDISYRDLNNDSRASKGEFFTVSGDGEALRTGLWYLELAYPGQVGGNTTLHFHVLPPGVESYPQHLEVDFIDVGQGDAELITTSDGRRVLIDTGTAASRANLVSYLHNHSVSVLDALVLTHPDADHIGGAVEVLRSFEVRSIYHPGLAADTATYRNFINASLAEGCPILTSATIADGDYLDISATEGFRVLSINASTETNDASIVIRLTTEGTSFLFTGDIGASIEARIVSEYPRDVDVDVLKVAHHGSKYSTADAFLDAATPAVAVIEVGQNSYGHPSPETLSRLAAHHVAVIRTDLHGTYAYVVATATLIS